MHFRRLLAPYILPLACLSLPCPALLLQSCDGWKEVAWNGEKLDVVRGRFQSHVRRVQARKAGPSQEHA